MTTTVIPTPRYSPTHRLPHVVAPAFEENPVRVGGNALFVGGVERAGAGVVLVGRQK